MKCYLNDYIFRLKVKSSKFAVSCNFKNISAKFSECL